MDKTSYAELARRPRLAVLLGLLGALAGAVVGAGIGWRSELVLLLPLVPLGVWLGYVDARTTYLPTRLIAPGYALVVVLVLALSLGHGDWDPALHAVYGWAVYGGLFLLMWLIAPGFGYGDVRLAGLLGLALGYLGWPEVLLGFFGGLLGIGVLGGVLALLKLVDPRRSPAGPYMLVAALLAAAFGPDVANALGY